MKGVSLDTLQRIQRMHSQNRTPPPTTPVFLSLPTVVTLCRDDETTKNMLTFYVEGRLEKVPKSPYIFIYGGSWEDWEKYIGPELMKEWDENTEDWEDGDEEVGNDEI